MIIDKMGSRFSIDDSDGFSRTWFEAKFQHGWEDSSFHVLAELLEPDKDFVDIGAWIGPITLFAASRARRVLAIEPDPVARQRLQRNLEANPDLTNIVVSENAVYPRRERIMLGGNGVLGNSESTVLVNDPQFFSGESAVRHWRRSLREWRTTDTVEVEGDALENILKRHKFSTDELGLIKVDVEGGEKLIIDCLLDCLHNTSASLFMSLHWCYLSHLDIERVVNKIASKFPKLHDHTMARVARKDVLKRQLSCVIGTRKTRIKV